jgi:uncharacterized protein YcnI
MKKFLMVALCLASPALIAHPLFEHTKVTASSTFKSALMITHGCGDSPTVKLIVDIPEDVLAVTPQIKPGWTVEKIESTLDVPREVFGIQTTKYTSQIIWSGNSLSSNYFDVFSFIIIPPGDATTLYFPTTQICEEGIEAYTSIPDPENPHEYVPSAAPSLTVVKMDAASGH